MKLLRLKYKFFHPYRLHLKEDQVVFQTLDYPMMQSKIHIINLKNLFIQIYFK